MKDHRKKITFVYAYEQEEWSTPIALAKEFRSIGWYVDYVSIGSNSLQNWNDVKLNEWIQSNPKTDIVLFILVLLYSKPKFIIDSVNLEL